MMSFKHTQLNRFQAAAIHFGLSVLVGALVLFLMLGLWYPGGFFKLLGGGDLLYIIMGVDVCLGPLLTLAVYNPAKKSLKFDLSVIAALQLAALLYGANVMFQSRPAFNVLEENVFKVTLASDIKDKTQLLRASNPDWHRLPMTGPKLIAAVAPTDANLIEETTRTAMAGMDWNVLPYTWVSYDSQRQVALSHAKPLSNLRQLSEEGSQIVDKFVKDEGGAAADYVYLPIVSGYVAMTAVLNAKTGDFVDVMPLDAPSK